MSSQFKEKKNTLIETLNENMGYFITIKEKLYETKTEFQDLEIYETNNFGKILRLDGVFQTSTFDEFLYHEPLAHVPAITNNKPKKALVIGGGDGGAAEEILKYSTIEKCVMVELDQGVVDASKKYIPEISNGAFNDPRLDLRIEDGIEYIKTAGENNEHFDQVLLDLTDPFGPSVALYTQEFYKSIQKILSNQGILSLHIESPISRPKVFARIFQTLCSVFQHVKPMLNYVPMYGTLWGFAIASDSLDPSQLTKKEIANRLDSHRLPNLKYYNPDTHHGLLSLPNYVMEILSQPCDIITFNDIIQVDETLNRNLFLGEW